MNNARQWLQICLGNIARITGIVTQGRRDAHQWVTRYVLSYGDGSIFKAYRERKKVRVSCLMVFVLRFIFNFLCMECCCHEIAFMKIMLCIEYKERTKNLVN